MGLVLQSQDSALKHKLFLTKDDYETCHIQIDGTQEKLPAIALGSNLYSFFKTIKDRDKALDILGKLYDNGNDAAITQTPKAYAIWILEEEASRLN
ncbi:hypothetical protein [Altericista sp. CCNU0014]|uniref:hypothetical protein n=1 Tax=Altericista sp. CCNU0014 TaxID=3082949 RepID=UPI00384C37D6